VRIVRIHLLIEDGSFDDDARDAIRVCAKKKNSLNKSCRTRGISHTNVGGWTSVFQVSVALRSDVPGHTNRRTTVSNARAETADMASLVTTRQPQVVVLAIHSDVLGVLLRQLLDSCFNRLHATRFAHGHSAVVRVAAGTVPVACEGLRVEGDLDAPLLSDTDEEEARHPEMVAHGNSLAGPDLELPLRRHDFSVDAADVHAGVETSTVVRLNEVACEDSAGT
jgi:hypothetical protein